MGITTTYAILFEVQLLHHYFLNSGTKHFSAMTAGEQAEMMLKYDVREVLDIVPTSECRKALERHRCIFKRTARGLIVGLKSEPGQNPQTTKPFIPITDDQLFTFHLHLKDFGFFNYTDLPLTGNTGRLFLFNNLKSGQAKGFPSLCAFPKTYDNALEYLPGDMAVDNNADPATLYTARLKTTAAPAGSSDWLEEKKSDGLPMSYAGAADRYPMVRQQLRYRVKTADVEPEVVVRTMAGTEVGVKTELLPGQFRTVQLDLRGLPEGLYSLHAESADHSYQDDLVFYLLQQQAPPFAVLQLTVRSNDTNYDMLDEEGNLLAPSYVLRFRNRATHWRYIGKKFSAASVTAAPLPLTRFGFVDGVTVPDKDGAPVDDLPNPEVSMFKAEALAVAAEKKFYSEIHIH